MKKIVCLLIGTFFMGLALGQVPQKLRYEAIIRDADFKALDSVQMGIQLSVVSDTTQAATAVYTETHTHTTSSSGLAQLVIGTGSTTDTFSNINWAEGPYYLKTQIDPEGGSNYTISGTTELLSVPYAQMTSSASVADTAGRSGSLNFRVSLTGDSLIFGSGQFLIIPKLSQFNGPFPFPSGYVHCNPQNPTIVDTVVSLTKKVWMDRNLGASRVAQSLDDTLAYGDLYQWGRFADGHHCRESDTTSIVATTALPNQQNQWDGKLIGDLSDWLSTPNDDLWQGTDGLNNPCPNGFRLPTAAELQEERNSWTGGYNKNGAFASPLKLTATGARNHITGQPFLAGLFGYYWSSTVSGSDARVLAFGLAASVTQLARRAVLAVRCIKSE